MAFGATQTRKFQIGVAELRIGPLTTAMKHTQAHSVGIIENISVEVAQNSVELRGGFPKKLVDTAIVDQTMRITAGLREYSRRNLSVLLGQGVPSSSPANYSSTLTANASAGATSLSVAADPTSILTAGKLVVVYADGAPEKVTVSRVTGTTSSSITLDSNLPLLEDQVIGAKVFNAEALGIGNITQTNYFSATLLAKEHSTGRAIGFTAWKASIATGLTYGYNADDFALTEIQINCLEPAASEYASGQPLVHLATLIPTFPIGVYLGGAD